jgi:hypothetical protein
MAARPTVRHLKYPPLPPTRTSLPTTTASPTAARPSIRHLYPQHGPLYPPNDRKLHVVEPFDGFDSGNYPLEHLYPQRTSPRLTSLPPNHRKFHDPEPSTASTRQRLALPFPNTPPLTSSTSSRTGLAFVGLYDTASPTPSTPPSTSIIVPHPRLVFVVLYWRTIVTGLYDTASPTPSTPPSTSIIIPHPRLVFVVLYQRTIVTVPRSEFAYMAPHLSVPR